MMTKAAGAETVKSRIPFYATFTANTISGAGNALANVAIPWFVLQITGSAGQAGLTAAAAIAPVILAGVLGGPLIDQFGYRRSSIVADLASGLPVALIPLLYQTIGLEFWQLLLLVFLGNLLDAPGVTARRSLVPELAQLADIRLSTANGRYNAGLRLAHLIGAPLAGVLIAVIGASNALWLNAGSFVVSAMLIVALVPRSAEPEADVDDEPSNGYLDDLKSAFNWIRTDRIIIALTITVLLTNLIEAPTLIVITVYASEVLESSTAMGVLIGGFGLGSTLGAFASGWFEARLTRRWIFPVGFLGLGIMYIAIYAGLPVLLLTLIALAFGFAAGPVNPMIDTIFQERVPRRMRGRVFGLRTALMMALYPLGVIMGGFLIDAFGYRTMLAIQVAAILAACTWLVIAPQFRKLDPPDTPSTT
ncbi:MAG: MFS transporter [Chloroflexota bacterium]